MNDRDKLIAELKNANEVKQRSRAELAEATKAVATARAKIRQTKEYKAWQLAKAQLKRHEQTYRLALSSHDQVEDELLSGMSGLELFDLVRAQQAVEAGAVAS